MGDEIKRSCVDCKSCGCSVSGLYPEFCKSRQYREEAQEQPLLEEVRVLYHDPENMRVAKAAAEVERDFYCEMTRVEEIAEFARRIGAAKLGIATCVGLIKEANAAARIFRSKGFEVVGVACKIGEIPKSEIDVDPGKLGPNMCNPIMQAKVLNQEGTDLNIVVGLCVGHDSLFYKYSDALCTTLVTKDRVLGHNPVAALQQVDGYYKKLLKKE